jgi:hypothetical protein
MIATFRCWQSSIHGLNLLQKKVFAYVANIAAYVTVMFASKMG